MLAALRAGGVEDFDALKEPFAYPDFQLQDFGVRQPVRPPIFNLLLPSVAHTYASLYRKYEQDLARVAEINEYNRKGYEVRKSAALGSVLMQQAEIDAFHEDYLGGNKRAIELYSCVVLSLLSRDESHQAFLLEYLPATKTLQIEYRLQPGLNRDELVAVVLEILDSIFESDRGHIDVVALNGYVKVHNPQTGAKKPTWLISLRVARSDSAHLKISSAKQIDLLGMGAVISEAPELPLAIEPLLQFSLALKQSARWRDISATTDSRPYVRDLTATEYCAMADALMKDLGFVTESIDVNSGGRSRNSSRPERDRKEVIDGECLEYLLKSFGIAVRCKFAR